MKQINREQQARKERERDSAEPGWRAREWQQQLEEHAAARRRARGGA
jgi:hypothetical protein